MKKILMLAACTAAMTAITSCSSNDDDVLPQAPVAPAAEETVVETSGIPFSVSAFNNEDSRAIRYGADGAGTDVDNSAAGYVNCFKLYAMLSNAASASDAWIPQYVFTRSENTDSWAVARDNSGANISTVKIPWPAGASSNGSIFYAVTDNAIAGGDGNPMNGVTPNFFAGTLDYELPLTENKVDVSASEIGTDYYEYCGWPKPTNAVADGTIDPFYAMDADAMKDLMVAKVTTDAGNTNKVTLPFVHALAGLSLKVKFHSADWAGVSTSTGNASFRIYGVRVHGLKTSGTLNLSNMVWDTTNGDSKPYYKGFGKEEDGALDGGTLAKGVYVEAENETNAVKHDLILKGEWFVIPQNTTAASMAGISGELPTSGTFVEIVGYRADTDTYGMGIFPFSINFEAGHNYSLVIDMTKVRNTAAITGGEYNLWFLDNQIGGGSRVYK